MLEYIVIMCGKIADGLMIIDVHILPAYSITNTVFTIQQCVTSTGLGSCRMTSSACKRDVVTERVGGWQHDLLVLWTASENPRYASIHIQCDHTHRTLYMTLD